jgi:histone H3/H4
MAPRYLLDIGEQGIRKELIQKGLPINIAQIEEIMRRIGSRRRVLLLVIDRMYELCRHLDSGT